MKRFRVLAAALTLGTVAIASVVVEQSASAQGYAPCARGYYYADGYCYPYQYAAPPPAYYPPEYYAPPPPVVVGPSLNFGFGFGHRDRDDHDRDRDRDRRDHDHGGDRDRHH